MYQYRELEGWDVDGDCFKKDSMVQAYTVNYVAAALEAYLKPGSQGGLTYKFLAKEYFQEVYRHNVDVWGFLMSYQDLINNVASRSYTAYRKSTICQLLSDILFKYCYSPDYAAKKIPVNQLKQDLNCFTAVVKSAPAKKQPLQLKLQKKLVHDTSPVLLPLLQQDSHQLCLPQKRCPTGYSKDPSHRKCRKKGTKKKSSAKKKNQQRKKQIKQENHQRLLRQLPLEKRCPKAQESSR